jgi:hypothetical protein
LGNCAQLTIPNTPIQQARIWVILPNPLRLHIFPEAAGRPARVLGKNHPNNNFNIFNIIQQP